MVFLTTTFSHVSEQQMNCREVACTERIVCGNATHFGLSCIAQTELYHVSESLLDCPTEDIQR